MAQKRIEFIDLAKGICMIALVLGHCGVTPLITGADTLPLYLIISGLFFKEYSNAQTFFTKKTNGILVPFIFFYLIGCIAFYLIKWFAPQLLVTTAGGIMDIFNNRQFFNGPIWFIIALFWCYIYFYLIRRAIKNDYAISLICILIGVTGWYMGYTGIFLPLFLDVAMTSLPFFALGYYLNQANLLTIKIPAIFSLILGCVFIALTFIIPSRISLHYNIMEGANSYIVGIIIAIGILLISKAFNRIPFISYCGRYSIVLLCVHHMIYRPLMVLLPKTGIEFLSDKWSIAIITLLLSALCIPVCKKLIPWFIAQKDLIKLPQKREKNVN
ncbi:MAG: acyltransferase [Bacteroidaceae bacterium]|nr:acyltransferase [Bacteroidaceae bacterium]